MVGDPGARKGAVRSEKWGVRGREDKGKTGFEMNPNRKDKLRKQ